ncbi:MAG: hypothetical protein C0513_02015 [Isosphaera sp.]|nr:hypothetical protein [Isosphaera sp.]
MDQFLRLLTLQDTNTRVVMLGTTVLGIASAVVGCFAVLRKRSLVGDAVAHAALPGICLAYLVVGERHFAALLLGAMLAGVTAAAFVAAVRALTRVKEDAAIGMAIGGFFGLGIVLSRLIQGQPGGDRAGLDSFIFGKAASMVSGDARLILAVALAALAAVALLYKELKLLCFDRDFAAGQGWPTLALDLALMALVCLCTVVGLPAVGVVLMVALLVIPAVAARFWTSTLSTMLVLAAIFGGASGLVGTALSATVPVPAGALSRGWPTGPLIVLVAAGIFGVSLLCAPRRGLLADLWRRAALRRRVALQNLLRDAHEWLEHAGSFDAPWRAQTVSRSGRAAPRLLARLAAQGLIAPAAGGFVLTKDGRLAAARVVRSHRLWELYLIEQADIAADHVDRDADQIEHILPQAVIAELEDRLVAQGRLPAPAGAHAVPESPHPIGAAAPMRGRTLGLLGGLMLGASALLSAPEPAGAAPHAAAQADPAAQAGSAVAAPSATPASAAEPTAEPAAEPGRRSHTRVWFTVGDYQVRDDDLWTAATAAVCSVACGLIGCFLVLRRMSLLGDAISHAILPGLALAFMLTHSRDPLPMLAGAMTVGVLTAVLSAGLNRWGKVPEDASMGVVFTTLFALGVVLVSLAARDVDLDPGCVLYGLIEFTPLDTVAVGPVHVPRALAWLALTLAMNTALIVLFYKELTIVCFDPALATAMGISATLVHYGLMTTVAITSVASFEAVGSILVIAMLVAPGATAHLLTDSLGRMLCWAAAIAAGCALAGYALAVWIDTSVAGMIATLSLAVFVLVALGAPRHGVIASRLRSRPLAAPAQQ